MRTRASAPWPGGSVSTRVTAAGMLYEPVTTDPLPDWYLQPARFPGHEEVLAFVSQLEELGRAEPTEDGGLLVAWSSVYWVLSQEDVAPTQRQLPVPPVDPEIVPALKSVGTLTDAGFRIAISGWHRRAGGRIADRLDLTGPVVADGASAGCMLRQPVFELVEAVRALQARPQQDRDAHGNKLAWARVRELAVTAGAVLDDFLRDTVVLRPSMLGLSMERVVAGNDIAVRLTPTFEGAPDKWIDQFDRSRRTDLYKVVDDRGGYFEVIVDDQVQGVLKELKSWPGRTVSGPRARRLLENPLAFFGPAASSVFDEEAVARELRSLRETAWSWRPAIDVQDGKVAAAGVRVDALGDGGGGRSDVRLFSSREIFADFLERADRATRAQAAFFSWNGLELEVDHESDRYVAELRDAFDAWREGTPVQVGVEAVDGGASALDMTGPFVIDAASVLDVSRYQERVDAIGVELPYGIITIPLGRKGAWLPEEAELRALFASTAGQSDVELALNRDELEAFVAAVKEAGRTGAATVTLPRAQGTMGVDRARDFVAALPASLTREVTAAVTGIEGDRPSPRPRTGLQLKSNIDDSDYVTRREIGLRPPDGAAPLLPGSFRDGVRLKKHQLGGLMWLQHLFTLAPEQCRGALLADDMGLGKTLQTLALIARAHEDDPDLPPALVVAPVTLLENWAQEIAAFFAPGSLPFKTLYGAELREYRVSGKDIDVRLRQQNLKKFLRPGWGQDAALVLTTYETLRDYEFSFGEVRWSIVVCDEAQRIKNPNALVSRAAKKLNARFCVAATGTPVENNLTDLWSLFDFVQPGLLEPLNRFNKKYRRPIEAKTREEQARVEELRRIIEPQILRRTKADVARDLPRKLLDERCRTLRMSARQVELYQSAVKAQRAGAAATEHAGIEILRLIGVLRRICTDPRAAHELDQPLPSLQAYRAVAPKMNWLISTLEEIRDRDEKAIVFLDRKDIQRLVQAYIREHFGFAPEIVNGETPTGGAAPDSRQRRIDRFQAKPGFNVMVLSPVAAGVGLNIQQANHVIHYMRHWNPAKEDQATDRAYRIGQDRDVTVYTPTVVGAGWVSFDERLDELLEKKRAIAANMLNGSDDLSAADFVDLVAG